VLRSIWNNPSIRWIYSVRILVFLALVFGITQPQFSRVRTRVKDLPWVMFIDNSLSINYHSNISLTSINTGLQSLVQQIRNQGVQLQLIPFSGEMEKEQEKPLISGEGTSTDIGTVIQYIQNNKSTEIAGAILLSDGQTTSGSDPVLEAKKIHVPVYAIAVGDTTPMVDVTIQSVDVPTVVIKGEDVEANVTISGVGPVNERVNVSLMSGKELLGSKFIRLHGDGSQTRVNFHFTPSQLGKNNYTVATSSLSDEINIENNRLSFDVSALKDEYHVALYTGAPSENTTVIKRWLKNHPRVKVTHIIQDAPDFEKRAKLFWPLPFDLIVFDNFPVTPLNVQTQRILAKKIVSQSSAIFWINGPNVSENSSRTIFPLLHVAESSKSDSLASDRTPVILDENWVKLPLALNNPNLESIVDRFPPMKYGILLESTIPSSWSILSFSESDIPILLINEKESLRSGIWTTPDFSQTYYKMLYTSESDFTENIFRGVFSWLMKTGGDQELYFRFNKNRYQQGEEILVTGNKIGKKSSPYSDVSITILKDSVLVNTYDLQYNALKERWEGSFWASSPGTYHYEIRMLAGTSISKQVGDFTVEESQIELNKVFVNTGLLKGIADETDGHFFWWHEKSNVVEYVKEKSEIEKSSIKFLPTESWWSLLIILFLLAVEWSWRRYRGLL